MRRYETIIIIDPDIPDELRSQVMERIGDIMDQQKGLLIEADEWGNRKLAYEIKKKSRGHYIRLEYCGTGPLVNELERFFKIDDRLLKFMTILLDNEVDLEAVKAQIAEAEAAKTAEAEAAKAAEEAAKAEAEAAAAEATETETPAEEEAPAADSDQAKEEAGEEATPTESTEKEE